MKKQNLQSLFLLTCFAVLFVVVMEADADRYVSKSGSDAGNDCSTKALPCASIQHAAIQADPQEHVYVAKGIYYENIVISAQTAPKLAGLMRIYFDGGYEADFSRCSSLSCETIIDGGQRDSVFRIDATGMYYDIGVWGFTIRNGNAERGGGILVRSEDGAAGQVMLVGNKMRNNVARYEGGAVYAINYFQNSKLYLSILSNTMEDNASNSFTPSGTAYSYGGAVSARCYGGELHLDLSENVIANNRASLYGSAVYVHTENGSAATTATFNGNRIWGNQVAAMGSVVTFSVSAAVTDATFINNIIAENKSTDGSHGGVIFQTKNSGSVIAELTNNTIARNDYVQINFLSYSVDSPGPMTATMTNNIVHGLGEVMRVGYMATVSASYSLMGPVTSDGTFNDRGHNISGDPLFVNPAAQDYHLRGNSPAVGAGLCGTLNLLGQQRIAPEMDFERHVRPGPGSLSCELWRQECDIFGCRFVCSRGRYLGCDIGADEYLTRGDFSEDGKADILWRNVQSGLVAVWLMNGTSFGSYKEIRTAKPDWQIAGTGDFGDWNGDGKSDILWRNIQSGVVAVWLMNGTSFSSYREIGTMADQNWQIAGTGDFNGDGQVDILWRNTSSGAVAAWLRNGLIIKYTEIGTVANPNWRIAGTGDFNGDGQVDILWQNISSGVVAVWLMNGTSFGSYKEIRTVNPDWRIAGTGDFNRDGQVDILWRNIPSGLVAVWLMNGTTLGSYNEIRTVANKDWQIAGPK